MPKTGLSDKEWQERLRSYAHGTFVFGRGQRPAKSSKWTRVLENIEKCPKMTAKANFDPLGRKLECSCGYHISVKVYIEYCIDYVDVMSV